MTDITRILCLGLCFCAVSCVTSSQEASDEEFIDSVSEALEAG